MKQLQRLVIFLAGVTIIFCGSTVFVFTDNIGWMMAGLATASAGICVSAIALLHQGVKP